MRHGGLFEPAKFIARFGDHGLRHSGELCDLEAVALAGWAVFDGMQEHDASVMLGSGQMHVAHPGDVIGQCGHFEVVGGKQRERTQVACHRDCGGPGQ